MLHRHLALIIIIIVTSLSLNWLSPFGYAICAPREAVNQGRIQQKTNRFFRFNEALNSWVPVELPYDLVTCVNDDCKVVGSILQASEKREETNVGASEQRENLQEKVHDHVRKLKVSYRKLLPIRKRVSFTKLSETSVWVTGESGSIFERFWNGVQWVIAPHDLHSSAGAAVSVFVVNQTILALSEAGYLYQMQLTGASQLSWRQFAAEADHSIGREVEQMKIKSGVVTNDRERAYFCTKNGSLLELAQVGEPPRFVSHGQPPGADVAAIADAGTIRTNLVFTISSVGDLYEHDESTKPPWKKHIWRQESEEDTSLIPSTSCVTKGLGGASSISIFLLTKAGKLVERRLSQRKWKWIVHGSSVDHLLTAITPFQQDETSDKYSLFLTTASGSVLEYQMAKQAGLTQEHRKESWINHLHPPHAKLARAIPGISFQFGRTFFPLDDGRLGELHLSGFGGENSGPALQVNSRRKMTFKYAWTVLDTPETEGWNAEYCTEERGSANCIMGVKDETNELGVARTMTRRRKGTQQTYLIPDSLSENKGKSLELQQLERKLISRNFRLRVMQEGRSFFMVSDRGLTYEYLYNDNVGLWLQHDHPTPMNGAVGSYNGSLFIVDIHGNLLIRERSDNELQWINCTAMKKGRQIIGGPPWDKFHSSAKVTIDDALYFVSKTGRLLQFTVALRNFKWKDCKAPAGTKIATIVDQQVLRNRIVFVIGMNGRLYQYNTLSGLWHEHYQSPHLVLSRSSGTAMRPSTNSLKGSLFMISEDGGLVEYHWNSVDGWIWVEHGTPNGVSFKGSPGPSYGGNQLLLIGSDGKVYMRYLDQFEWKWKDFSFPDSAVFPAQQESEQKEKEEGICTNAADSEHSEDLELSKNDEKCDPRVAPSRPIPSAEDSVTFELKDGRLAEMRRVEGFHWIWSRTIATPTTSCFENFWAPAA